MIAAKAASTVPCAAHRNPSARLAGLSSLLGLLGAIATVGCSQTRTATGQASPYSQATTIAVAPAMNFSGSSNWDPVRMGDLMASELSQVPGINVVGVNRVLAVLARQGRDGIVSPAHALEVCDQLGVDAILVFAITEFDPYDPPVVGLAAQIYGPRPRAMGFDPVATSRQSRPFPTDNLGNEAWRPWAQAQRTYNAAHESVQKAVESYGKTRDAERSPMGWRKYVASQELYMRFCCHSALCELMEQERNRVIAESVAMTEPTP